MRSSERNNREIAYAMVTTICEPARCVFAESGKCSILKTDEEVIVKFGDQSIGCEVAAKLASGDWIRPGSLVKAKGRIVSVGRIEKKDSYYKRIHMGLYGDN